MNLFRIGDTVLNLDRINAIQDHADRTAGKSAVLRVLFDDAAIDLVGVEAETFRQWYRHAARNLLPQRDEDGEALISPEEQLKRLTEALLVLLDRERPRDAAARRAAHRLSAAIDAYVTGELQPARAKNFEKSLERRPDESPQDSPPTTARPPE